MIIAYNEKEMELLARIMRAEALAEGEYGMLMVGNVVTNRVLANCLTFKKIKSITDAIYQKNQFVGTTSSLFQARPTTKEKDLAKRVLKGEYYYPATHSLWFYAPGKNACKDKWFEGNLAGKYQNHCFYKPAVGECPQIY